jgi:hypothetical protein
MKREHKQYSVLPTEIKSNHLKVISKQEKLNKQLSLYRNPVDNRYVMVSEKCGDQTDYTIVKEYTTVEYTLVHTEVVGDLSELETSSFIREIQMRMEQYITVQLKKEFTSGEQIQSIKYLANNLVCVSFTDELYEDMLAEIIPETVNYEKCMRILKNRLPEELVFEIDFILV